MDKPSEIGPVVVGVDGSERSIDALALADVLGPALARPVAITYVHAHGELGSLLSEGEYEQALRDLAEATVKQIREHLVSAGEREMKLVSAKSAAAGLQTLAERVPR